jgi:hypothetical protein
MRTPSLWSSCFAALLVWTLACTKASFAPTAGGAAGVQGTGGTTDIGDSGQGEPCPPPVIACFSNTVPTVGCDPVCQTGDCGDWCGKKCTWVAAGINRQAACATLPAGQQTHAFDPCTQNDPGGANQTDACVPGYMCLPPSTGDLNTYCFQLCASSADCIGGTFCGQRPISKSGSVNVNVCDPPVRSCPNCCNPLDPSGCPLTSAGDPAGAQYCYMVSPDLAQPTPPPASQTVCEFSTGGGDKPTCDTARDCLPRFTCVQGACKQVCSPISGCASGAKCMMWGPQYGYCPS